MRPKIILSRPHIDVVGSDIEKCCDYRLTEEVEGITTGEVGGVYDASLTNADVLEQLKSLAVGDINARQSTWTFTLDDVVTWECSL